MSKIQPGIAYTTPGAQRTLSSISGSNRNHPYSNNNYSNSPSTSNLNNNQKYSLNRNSISNNSYGSNPSPKSVQRQNWAKHFGGPSYLEGGSKNRITLSLKSSIPSEIDWALNRLIIVSGTEPDLIRLYDFQGLLEALLNLIKSYVTMLQREEAVYDSILMSIGGSNSNNEEREKIRIRATEAGMILRNIASDKDNSRCFSNHKPLTKIITSVLEEGNGEGIEKEESAELRVYLLEILEFIADSITLSLPGTTSRLYNSQSETDLSPSVRLFPLLVALTHSTDRALVLASFRCLCALSVNERSDPVLALSNYNSTATSSSHFSHPIQRAIDLLTLSDQELAITILNFIYYHTLLPSNAVSFCARPELNYILDLIISKIRSGQNVETITVSIPTKDAAKWYDSLPPRHRPVKEPTPSIDYHVQVKLDPSDPLRTTPEPKRCLEWLRTVYEVHEPSEVTQVSLWTAYKSEFESTYVVILPAAELISLVVTAFPTALPIINTENQERRFVITGIRIKDRTDLKLIYNCRWNSCPSPIGPNSPSSLSDHIYHTHLAIPNPPQKCCWLYCDYIANSSIDQPQQLAKELAVHFRIHTPIYTPPIEFIPASKFEVIEEDPPKSITYIRTHASDKEGKKDSNGIGYISCLIIRNISRIIKLACTVSESSIESLSEQGSIFDEFERVSNKGVIPSSTPGDSNGVEKVDYTIAKKGIQAFLDSESKLFEIAVQDIGLVDFLSPVLSTMVECDKIVNKRE